MIRILTTLAVLLCACALASPIEARQQVVQIGRTNEVVDLIEIGEIEYLSFSQIATAIGGRLDWETPGHLVRYYDDTLTILFLLESPFLNWNGTMRNLTYGAKLHEGQLYLPAVTFLPLLLPDVPVAPRADTAMRRVAGESISLDRSTANRFTVPDIGIAAKANGLLIEIALSEVRAYDIFVTEGNWLNVSIRDARINAPKVSSRRVSRHLVDLKVHQEGATGQISLRLKRPISAWHHTILPSPPTIQISIIDDTYQPIDADTSAGPRLTVDDKIDVIIVDAGHGGVDYGAIGPKKTREKDITLAIAREIAREVRTIPDMKVIMTRERDRTVSLDERARIANESGADLFISIHANASPKPAARGWNVFFLAPAKNDSARAVAQFENSFFLREENTLLKHREQQSPDSSRMDPITAILNEMLMTEFQEESETFSLMLERHLRSLPIRNRGVDQAGFFVLNKVFMPSVLIETGFITNPSEERLIAGPDYHRKVARAVSDAIREFKTKYESR